MRVLLLFLSLLAMIVMEKGKDERPSRSHSFNSSFLGIQTVSSYTILLEQNFGEASADCTTDDLIWRDIFKERLSDCDSSCHFEASGKAVSSMNITTQQVKIKAYLKDGGLSSIYGVDITYFSTDDGNNNIFLSTNEQSFTNIVNPATPSLSFESEMINCSGKLVRLHTGQLENQSISDTTTQLQQQELTIIISKSEASQHLQVRSLRIWTNCSENCLICNSATQCGTCIKGFEKHVSDDEQKTAVCETTSDCSSTISEGCQQCVIIAAEGICSKCTAGFSLVNKSCQKNKRRHQYQSTLKPSPPCIGSNLYKDRYDYCREYSSAIYYQKKNRMSRTKWVSVPSTDAKRFSELFKCEKQQIGLVYDVNNFGLFRCGCVIDHCDRCTSPKDCTSCLEGFYVSRVRVHNTAFCERCTDQNCADCRQDYGRSCQECKQEFHLNKAGKCVLQICQTDEIYDDLSQKCVSDERSSDEMNELDVGELMPTVSITEEVTNSGYVICLDFQATIHIDNHIERETLMQMQVQPTRSFFFEVLSVEQSTISVRIIPKESFEGVEANFTLIDQEFIALNKMKETSFSTLLSNFTINDDSKVLPGKATEISPPPQSTLPPSPLSSETALPQQQTVALIKPSSPTSQTLGLVGQTASTAVVASMIPITILSNFYVIVNTIDLTGYLYYLLFIDVELPQNVLSFYSLFQYFQFPFIPNILMSLVADDYVQEAPIKFKENETQLYFIVSAGQSVTIVIAVIVAYIIGKGVSDLRVPYVSAYLRRVMTERWEYNAFFDLLWTVYINLIVSAFLQFKCFEFTDDYAIVNYTLHGVISIIVFSAPVLITVMLGSGNWRSRKKQFDTLIGGVNLYEEEEGEEEEEEEEEEEKEEGGEEEKIVDVRKRSKTKQLKDREKNQRISQSQLSQTRKNDNKVIEGYVSKERGCQNDSSQRRLKMLRKLSWLYSAVLYWKKILFAAVIVFLYELPRVQLQLLTSLNLLMVVYIVKVAPLDKQSENYKLTAGELVMSVVQTCMYIILDQEDFQQGEAREAVGWVIVGVSAFIFSWHALGIFSDLVVAVCRALRPLSEKIHQDEGTREEEEQQQQQQKASRRAKGEVVMVAEISKSSSSMRTTQRHVSWQVQLNSATVSPLQSQRKIFRQTQAKSQLARNGRRPRQSLQSGSEIELLGI